MALAVHGRKAAVPHTRYGGLLFLDGAAHAIMARYAGYVEDMSSSRLASMARTSSCVGICLRHLGFCKRFSGQ